MIVEAQNVEIFFGRQLALPATSLKLEPGAQWAITGPAGTGKTSLLKALAGLRAPTSGQVLWSGQDAYRLNAVQRREAQRSFGMVFQSDALFDSLSVLDNVCLPLRKRKVPESEALTRAQQCLEQVGLAQMAGRRPEELSGGQKKRVGIARAVAVSPQVLLADDPFAGLDPETEATIAKLLLDVSAGKTLVVALPDPLPTFRLSHHLALSRAAPAEAA